MKVKFNIAWQDFRVGEIIDPPASKADWLIANGYCEKVDTGSIEAPLTRATLTLPRRRK